MENTMTSMIKVFENKEFGTVRTIEDGDKVLFCGSDVAKALGYAIPSKAVNTHCKGVSKMEAPSQGGMQTMLFIPEGDVYRLIARSKLPEAEKFEKWVFDEVLPTIRKHGMYVTPITLDTMIADPDFAIGLLTNLKEERAARLKAEQERAKVEAQNQIMLPKADYFDKLVDAGANLGIRQFAKELKVSERKLVNFMLDNKYLYRPKKGKLLPYAEYTGTLFEVKEFVTDNGYTNVKTLFTPAGRDYFLKLGIADKLKEAC